MRRTLTVGSTLLLLAACNNGDNAKCASGTTLCNKTCTVLQFDPSNCGACGTACASGQLCINGKCAVCGPGLTACSQGCVDVQSDFNNCGGCSVVCNPGEACRAGTCTLACPSGLQLCPSGSTNVCVDNGRDPLNCGGCGITCKASEVCLNGNCQLDCPQPYTGCMANDAGYCADELHDPGNCGACGNVCGAGTMCVMGSCALQCPASFKICPAVTVLADGGLTIDNSDGGLRCVDPKSDPLNCGGCGADDTSGLGTYPHACGPAVPGNNTAPTCVNGSCQAVCLPGFLDCDTSGGPPPAHSLGALPNDEVCIDPNFDDCNCGGCGNVCDGWNDNGSGSCFNNALPAAQVCCSNQCKDLLLDTSCGTSCGDAAACDGGSPTCCANAANTGGACTNTNSDLLHCGACDGDCTSLGYGKPGCCTGACDDLSRDTNNCNGCGNACTADAGVAACCPVTTDAGVIGACTDTNNDTHNCGGCGNDCETQCGAPGCTNGGCNCS